MSRLFHWTAKKTDEAVEPRPSSRIVETLSASRALPKFLSALSHEPSPILLDLGSVVGANVAFFGERLACKMLIEDLQQDIEAHTRRGSTEGLADVLTARVIDTAPEPVHGVLCWDVFDYLERPVARALGACLARILRPKGVLHGLFGATSTTIDYRTKFILQSDSVIKCRREPSVAIHRHALQTGEISRLFPGLTISESVLLQTNTRESLFRKA